MLVARVSEQIAILLSFLFCLSLIWMYFFLFLPNPLSLVLCPSLSMSLSLSMFVSVCMSLSFYVFFPLFPSLSPRLLYFFLSLTLAVSTFGENSTGALPGKVLLLCSSSSSSALTLALHHRIKLAFRSFFLCSSDHLYSCLLYRTLSYSLHATEIIQIPQSLHQ